MPNDRRKKEPQNYPRTSELLGYENDGKGWEWVSLDPELNPTTQTQEDITTDITGENTPITPNGENTPIPSESIDDINGEYTPINPTTSNGENTPITLTGENTPIPTEELTIEDNHTLTAGQKINYTTEQSDSNTPTTQDIDLLAQEAKFTSFTSSNPGNPRRKSISVEMDRLTLSPKDSNNNAEQTATNKLAFGQTWIPAAADPIEHISEEKFLLQIFAKMETI